MGQSARSGAWVLALGLGGAVAACGGEPPPPPITAPPASSSVQVAPPVTAAPTVAVEAPPVLGPCSMTLPAGTPGAPRKEMSLQERQLYMIGDACSLLAGGRVACWSLGRFNDEEWTKAVVLGGLSDVVSIDRGGYKVCGLTSAGSVKCAELVHDPKDPNPRAPFEGLSGVAQLEGRCARMRDGQVKCVVHDKKIVTVPLLAGASRLYPFQEGACGLVGARAVCASIHNANLHAELEDVVEMDTNHGVFCGRGADGRVRCRDPWGYDDVLELEGLRGTTQLTVTRGSVCAIADGGQVVCSGLAAGSDVGIQGGKAGFRVPGVDHARSLALTMLAGCAILEDGRVACFKQFPRDSEKHPPCVTPITGAVEIRAFQDARDTELCVRRAGGEVLCFEPDGDIRRVEGLP